MGLGIDGSRPGADGDEQAMEALVENAGCARSRGQIPGGALEEIGPGMLHPSRLRTGEGVPAHEALIGPGLAQGLLGRADVADDAIGASSSEHRIHTRGKRAHGTGEEDNVGSLQGLPGILGTAVDGTQLEGPGERGGVGVVTPHLRARALTSGETDGAPDETEAEDCDPQEALSSARAIRGRRSAPCRRARRCAGG